MHKNIAAIALAALTLSLAACDDSSSPTTAPSTTTERVKQDITETGHEIKTAGDDLARKADPAIEKAKGEAKDTLHAAAQKVAEMTSSTQPATTIPATPPPP